MAKFLDLNGLETFLAKVKDWVNTLVNSTKSSLQSSINNKVDKTTTVNGHALSGNVTVTKSDVSLGNVTNDAQVKRSEMGQANGVATLDESGKIPSSYLPSYVDDVLEYDNKSAFPASGEAGKIYVAKDTNLTYRWSGSAYVEISPSLALGETSSTAYPGDKGAENRVVINSLPDVVMSVLDIGGRNPNDMPIRVLKYLKYGMSYGELESSGSFSLPAATSQYAGLMSGSDKSKLDGIASGANNYTHPTSSGNKHIPSGGSSGQILRWSADGTAVWGNDNNTTYSAFKGATSSAAGGSGLVPAPAAGNQSKYLRGDGTWQTPPDTNTRFSAGTGLSLSGTTFSVKTGYTTSGKNYKVAADSSGNLYVSVPWTDTNTTYSIATASTAGLVKPVSVITKPTLQSVTTTSGKYYQVQMSSDGNMFVNVPWTDTNTIYSLPLAASGTRGGIKIGYTSTTNNRAVQLSSEKAYVNIPNASSSTTGLMSSTMYSKLNGIASGATADSAIPTSVINGLS